MYRPSLKLHPFRGLVLLLYGSYSYVEWLGPQQVRVRIGPFAKLLRVSNDRMREYLTELQSMRYIGGLTHEFAYATLRIIPPPAARLGLTETP